MLRPNGRALLLVWGPHQDVWWSPVIDIIERRAAYFSSVCPMMFFYGLPGVLPRMLEQMGLAVEAAETLDSPMTLRGRARSGVGRGPRGPAGSGLFQNRLDDDAKASAWQEMTERVTAQATTSPDGITLPAQVLAVVARKTG